MRNFFLIVFITVLYFSTLSEIKAQSFLNNGKIPKDLKITLERLGCLGICPTYFLVIKANGNGFFNSKQFKKNEGRLKDKLTKEQIEQIIGEFEEANFFALQNSYIMEKDGCQKYPPDGSAEKISIRVNGKRKTVLHYRGCGKTIIRNLGERIDEITNSKRWIKERK